MIHRERRDELGVSEVVGFIIVLGIVFMSIGMVYANAIPVLEDNREHQHITNTEKIFYTFQGNVHELTDREAPRRATHLRLFESEVRIGEPTYQVNVTTEQGPDPDWERIDTGSTVIYDHNNEHIVYENGAVIRTAAGRNSSAMAREPGWSVRENQLDTGYTAILNGVTLLGTGSVSGDGPILIRKDVALRTEVHDRLEQGDDVLQVRVTSEYADSWQQYFERLESRVDDIETHHQPDDDYAQIQFNDFDDNRVMYVETKVNTGITT